MPWGERNRQCAQRLSGVWFPSGARAAAASVLRPRENASAGRGAFPASLGRQAVAGGVCNARCCVIVLRFCLSVLLSKRQTRLQVINCVSCNSSPISAACSRSHPRIWNKNVRSEAGSALTSADFTSPRGAGVPVLRRHRLTPPERGKALANHKYISIFLPSVLISLHSKKMRGGEKVRGCTWACLCATVRSAGWQRRHCSRAVAGLAAREGGDLRRAYRIGKRPRTGVEKLLELR